MNQPFWLSATLLATTALVLPGTAMAQDGGASLPPQPTEEIAADPTDAEPGGAQQNELGSAPDVSLGGEIIVTGRVQRDEIRNSAQVLNVLSTEDIARTGEGDIAGALSHVTGLSVVGDGYVYVRGLGDRYSLAMLNGLPLPSPEPLKRVVPLDIFPTNVVASSLVQKTYSANYPGEFGGGVINLTTIAIPDESFLTVGGGISGNTETTGHFGYSYYGAGSDWTGFDNSTRDVPPNLNAFFASGRKLSEFGSDTDAIIPELVNRDLSLTQKLDQVPVDWSASVTGGTSFYAGDALIGVIATASYSNEWRTRDILQQSATTGELDTIRYDGRSINTDNNIKVNGLLGIGVELNRHKFRFTNLYIRDTVKQTRMRDFNDSDTGFDYFEQNTAWYERQLINSQFVGEMHFGDLGIDLRASYANSQREAPFETTFLYAKTNKANDPFGDIYLNRLNNGESGAANIAFSDLNEDLWAGGIDFSYLLTDRLGASVGYAYTDTSRKSARREFAITAPQSTPTGVFALRPDFLIGSAPVKYFNYSLTELTETSPGFAAGLEVNAGYAKINWEPIDYVTLDLGVRYETADQTVRSLNVFVEPPVDPISLNRSNDYFLPGGTITWQPSSELQLRASASKTIARPQFRELLPVLYYDPETNRSFRGNPLLVDSKLFNAEVRAEYYLGGGERVTIGGFYKKIDNPIEVYIQFGANGTSGNFANAPEAQLYGVEVEGIKYFDLYDWGGMFQGRRLFTIANYTFTDSKLNVGDDDKVVRYGLGETAASNVFTDGTPMTGQSDHLANLQFGMESTDKLSQQTILLNYASKRVVGRGDGTYPDIIEEPGLRVDFVWREGIDLLGIDTEWKFEARNIFGQNNEEYQANDDYRIDINTYDLGTKLSLSVSANF
ncbi:TonB-dependent receptor domain-containing protein [Altericroceibacterium endophyticum]|uniref:TonB-dependent receptor n=1 Tax=Altericroceibacterium endophyticum TaxID=1808508 RepID=A0A6I4T9H0_9SPHN|nr:TonB-dependent receptor [Altericroceibacterium endophyticum]MXO66801.1 TonB-dependent receptor [Altericroceibacterium endophyticum]